MSYQVDSEELVNELKSRMADHEQESLSLGIILRHEQEKVQALVNEKKQLESQLETAKVRTTRMQEELDKKSGHEVSSVKNHKPQKAAPVPPKSSHKDKHKNVVKELRPQPDKS